MTETGSVLEVGEKLHIMTRRNFPDDLRRHFVGEVVAISGNAMRVEGYAFVFNPTSLEYKRREELRTRIFAIADTQLIINVMPQAVKIDRLRYATPDGRLVVTDGVSFSLDINEFNATH